MIQYVFSLVTWVYKYPFVNQVIKKSIMGHRYDKTIDYYRNVNIVSPIDETFIVRYKVNSNEYIIHCNSETYNDALVYIKQSKISHTENHCILSAYEDNISSVRDITDSIIKHSGPLGDFYKDTIFEVKCSDITENSLTIISTNLNIYNFKGDEKVSLDIPSFLDIRALP